MTKNVNKIMAFASCGLLLLLTAIVVKLMVGVDSLPVLFFLLCFVMSVVAFLCYNITKRRMDGASWSALFVSKPCFDVLMLMAFVPAYAEDKQEEVWWPVAAAVFTWCSFDLLRHALAQLTAWREKRMLSRHENESCTADASRSNADYSIDMYYSLRFNVGTMMFYLFLCLLLNLLCFVVGFNYLEFFYRLLFGFPLIFIFQYLILKIKADGSKLFVSDPFRAFKVYRINVNEIESVTVSRTLLGCRLTFCYGYGKKAVAYPADLNDVTAYLKRYRIAVDYDDKKQ